MNIQPAGRGLGITESDLDEGFQMGMRLYRCEVRFVCVE